MPVGASHQFPAIYLDDGLLEIHGVAMRDKEWHTDYGIFTYSAYAESRFNFDMPYTEWKSADSIEWQLGSIGNRP